MGKYKPFYSDTEILGQVVKDFENAAQSTNFLSVLEKHGFHEIEPDEWYPAQKWLDLLSAIEAETNELSLVSLGMEQIKLVEWPPEYLEMTLLEVLQGLNEIYQTYYRGTDIGEVAVTAVNPAHIKVTLRVFEPSYLWYGNIYQLAKTFCVDGQRFVIRFDEESPTHDEGGENTIIHIHLVDLLPETA